MLVVGYRESLVLEDKIKHTANHDAPARDCAQRRPQRHCRTAIRFSDAEVSQSKRNDEAV